jgi:hypothetical protein
MGVGLSWQDYLMIQVDADAASPYADTAGFGTTMNLDTAVFLPMNGAESVQLNPNTMISTKAERTKGAMVIASGARIVSGSIPVAFPIGCWGNSGGKKLRDWCFGWNRDYNGDPHQLPSATVYICVRGGQMAAAQEGTDKVKKVIGAKVSRITIESPAGNNWVNGTIEIIGCDLTKETSGSGSVLTNDIEDVLEHMYLFQNNVMVVEYKAAEVKAYVGTSLGDATYTSGDPDMLGWSFTVDNMLGEDGHRLDGTGKLRRLYNLGTNVTGSFSRDFRTDAMYDAFLAEDDVYLGYKMTRGTNVAAAEVARARLLSGGPSSGGQRGSYNQDSYAWSAFGNPSTSDSGNRTTWSDTSAMATGDIFGFTETLSE